MNDYKVIQLITFFVTRFNYKIMSFGKTIDPKEVFLFNNDRPIYKIIRISSEGLGSIFFNPNALKNKVETVKNFTRCKDTDVLNIHISNDEPDGSEAITTVCLETDYSKGVYLADIFPGIYAVVHDVENPNDEIKELYLQINRAQEAVRKSKVKTIAHSEKPYITFTFMVLAVIGFGLTTFLPFGQSINALLAGIAYKPLVCLNLEFHRCILSTFVATDFATLAINLLCLYFIGPHIERRIGHLAYAITFLLAGFFGNILWCIFGPNYFMGGMSAAIDGIFAIIVIQAILDGSLIRNKFFFFLIMFNIFTNVTSGVYGVISFGGAIVGVLMYFMLMYKNDKVVYYNFIGCLCVLVLLLCYKASTIRDIKPIYKGTDLQYVSVTKNLGLTSYSEHLEDTLYKFYGGY